MFRATQASDESATRAAPPVSRHASSPAEEIEFCLLNMHAESMREAVAAGEAPSATGATGSLRKSGKVVADRQEKFLVALYYFGGMEEYPVDHERALEYLCDARDNECASAMAVLFADYPDERVRQTCFQVLRCVSLEAAGVFYTEKMVVACQTLCARMCELQLAKPRDDYDYVVEYGRAKSLGCLTATIFLAAVQERDGQLTEALRGYTLAAKGGYAVGCFHLARCTKDGIGVERSLDEAMQTMKRSSDKKFYWAMYERAKMLLDAAVSDSEAFKLLKAVEAGVDYAYKHRGPARCLYLQFCSVPNPHRRLAMCYEKGRGVLRNSVEAERHMALFRLANQGN